MRPKPFVRVCAGCKKQTEKQNLIRFTKKDGEIMIDKTGKMAGRGAYVCYDCIKNINQNKVLNKAFKTNVSKETYEKIMQELKEN